MWFHKLNHPLFFFAVIAQSKDSKNHKDRNHMEWIYHLIRKIVRHGDVIITKVALANNLGDSFNKALTSSVFHLHVDRMWVRYDIL